MSLSNRIVSDAAIEEALSELAKSDDLEAKLRASCEYGDVRAKELLAKAFIDADGNNAEKDAKARLSEEYTEHMKQLRAVKENHQALRNKRDRYAMIVDVWRTESSNLRGRT